MLHRGAHDDAHSLGVTITWAKEKGSARPNGSRPWRAAEEIFWVRRRLGLSQDRNVYLVFTEPRKQLQKLQACEPLDILTNQEEARGGKRTGHQGSPPASP